MRSSFLRLGYEAMDSELNEVTKVLVIDDEAPIRLLCRVNLEAEGMEVLETSAVVEASEIKEYHTHVRIKFRIER